MIYLLDTNVISDIIKSHPQVIQTVQERKNDHIIALCEPVDYEIQRGFLWRNASSKHDVYIKRLKKQFTWITLQASDWEHAAILWSQARKMGRQLSDVDFLIAAVTIRFGGILVSADDDFKALSIPHENWRNSNP